MQIQHERGYLIPAINSDSVDYEACAHQLAHSIRQWHPDAHVTILTRDQLPHGDLGGYANDWQCWQCSPYRQTIKLEADMIATSPFDHWWNLFEHRDVVISRGARDFYNQTTTCRQYRKMFDDNQLPDLYNAITYWRVSHTAQQFFHTVRNIFQHWNRYKTLLKFPEDKPSTDLVYAMAAVIMEPECVTLPEGIGPTIVHMKKHIIPISSDEWPDELVWEKDPIRINTVSQWGMLHYHVKTWSMA